MESLDDGGGEILAEAGGAVGKGVRAGPWGRRRSPGGRAPRRGMVSVKEMAVASGGGDGRGGGGAASAVRDRTA
jgi:hypothetical protein